MSSQILLVKNMVCQRCVLTVEDILKREGIHFEKVLLGEIHLPQAVSASQKKTLAEDLRKVGFVLIDDRTGELIERVKQLIMLKARNSVDESERRIKLSTYLSSHLHHEYTSLSNLFSSVEGRTIENYFIAQRIEYVKELIVYGHMNLSQIAMELEYSSAAHLSSQFKKVTGLTPSHFRQVGAARRKSLDEV